MKLLESDVKKFATDKELKVFQPEKVKENEEFINTIKELNPDVICVVAYRKNTSKRNFRNSKIWLHKCSRINTSKI